MSSEKSSRLLSERTSLQKGEKTIPLWIEFWLVISAVICLFDVVFTMFRPHTTTGALKTFYVGWNLYASVDKRYADENDIVTCATGRVMLIEILLNLVAVYLNRRRSRHALLTAFTSTAFVLWKTIWFLVLYIRPPAGNPDYFLDTDPIRIFIIFWVPNGIWVVLPAIVMVALWNRLAIRNEPRYEIVERDSSESP